MTIYELDPIRRLLQGETWMVDAACRGMGPRKFFPERGESQAPGKSVCDSCTVSAECRQYADETEEQYGMWSGKLRSRGNHLNETDEETYVIPKSLSATALISYLTCSARFKAEKIDRADTPGGEAASIGTACHTTFEVWVKDGHHLVERSIKEQLAVIKGIYDEAYWREFADGVRFDDGWAMVQTWVKRQDWSGREVLSTERKESFDIPTTSGPIPFNYIMDRVDKLTTNDDELVIEVVDYKSISMPMSPAELKNKPQARLYALAAQLKYPEATRIWVTFDMIRHEPIGVVFSKEENRATYKWLHAIAQRIVEDEDAQETLNDECRWCVRKSKCNALQRHVDAGGPLGITDPAEAANKYAEITFAMGGLTTQQRELEAMLLDHMRREDEMELELGNQTVSVSVSRRRNIDDERVLPVIGEALMAKYGSITMGKLDAMMKSGELTDDQRSRVKGLITNNFGDPHVKVKSASPF